MQHLVVGLDGSENSRIALRWAAAVAQALELRLRVVQAWQYPSDAILSLGRLELPSPERMEEQLVEQLRQVVETEVGLDTVPTAVEVARGPPADVLRHATTRHTHMVVVGSRGLDGFEGLLLGSVSRQLVEHATCPVTIVGATAPVWPLRLETIVVGLDGSAHASRALGFAAELARPMGAELVVAHAVPPATDDHRLIGDPRRHLDVRRDLVAEWCGPLREADLEHRIAVVEGDARTALLQVAEDHDADLLVVGSRGLGPVAKLVLGSVASSLAHHRELPLTIVPHVR